MVVAHKFLVSAPVLLEFVGLSHNLGMGIGTWDKKGKVKISPPTFKYNKISDHFKPKPKRPNDPKDEDKRGPGS